MISPSWFNTESGRMLSVPYPQEVNDHSRHRGEKCGIG